MSKNSLLARALLEAVRVGGCFVMALLTCSGVDAAEAKMDLPKQDVIAVPAIGAGLCVSNAFQTNMVLQRDKPLKIRGWADAGDAVTVACAGQPASATAGRRRKLKGDHAAGAKVTRAYCDYQGRDVAEQVFHGNSVADHRAFNLELTK